MPKTTIYWWARQGIVVPSVSQVREKLWSYSDLMALRIVSWLRHPKPVDGRDLPAGPMPQVRRALQLLDEWNLNPWDPQAPATSPLLVDAAGEILIRDGDQILTLNRQRTLLPEHALALTDPFTAAGRLGPDLVRPRPHLRIVPAKVAGEPHIEHSRVTTQTIAALANRGYTPHDIADMYEMPAVTIKEALDLEGQLAADPSAAA